MQRTKKPQSDVLDDRTFFLRFYEENKGFLYFTARKYTIDPSDCEDIVQDAVLRLLNNIPALRPLDKKRALKYVALTVRSSFLDHTRKKRPGQVLTADDRILEDLVPDECPGDPMAVRTEIIALKQSLPPRDWMILEGHYILGYSYEELSCQLGLTPENIRMIVSRAKEKARRLLLGNSEKGGSPDA